MPPTPAETGALPAALSPRPAPDIGTLYRDNHRWLHDWLRRKLGCAFEAADLAHDTFVRVLAGRDLAAIREPRAYLTTVAHGLLVNHLRRRAIERAWLAEIAAMPEPLQPDAQTRAIALETLMQIDAMLDGLAPRVRQAFLLAQLEGLSYADIGARLGVSVSSVKQYMLKATLQCLKICA